MAVPLVRTGPVGPTWPSGGSGPLFTPGSGGTNSGVRLGVNAALLFETGPSTQVVDPNIVDAGTASLSGQSSAAATGNISSNLVGNFSFEIDTSGWSPLVYSSITRSNSVAHEGSWSATGTTSSTTVSPGILYTTFIPVTANVSYDISFWVYDVTITHLWKTRIDWYNGGTYLSTSSSSGNTSTLNTWTQVIGTATAPATATQCQIYLTVSSTNTIASGETTYFDDVSFSKTQASGSASLSGQSSLTLVRPTNDNLLDGESVEETASNWGTNSASASARVTTQAHTGSASFQTTASGAATYGIYVGMLPSASRPSVTPGTFYEFSVWVKEGTRAQVQAASIEWRDATSLLSTTTGTPTTTTTAGWTKLVVSGVAPTGADRAGLVAYTTVGNNPTAGDISYWDDAYFRILPNSQLTAQSNLTANTSNVVVGSASESAQSTLTAAGTYVVVASASETGQSSLSATSVMTAFGATALSGQSTLSASATYVQLSTDAMSGQSTLTGAGTVIKFGATALTGQSSLTAAGVAVDLAAASLSGQSALTAIGLGVDFGAVLVAGNATLTATTGSVQLAAAALSGQSTLTSAGSRFAIVATALTGQSTLTAAGALLSLGATSLSGQSVLTATGVKVVGGATALTGQSTLTSAGLRIATASGSLSGQSVLSCAGGILYSAVSSMSSDSIMNAMAESYTPEWERWGVLFI